MTIASFLINNKWIILFYITIISIILFKRDKFKIHAKVIAIYKTKVGLNLMNKLATRYRELFKLLGYISVGVGFAAMVYIVIMIISNLYQLLTVPGVKPGIGLILPGVHIPGSPVFVPFWFGIISIFIVIVIHEFSHGVLARVHKINVKSSGLMLFGPIPGAFVEPDEKSLRKLDDIKQYSIFAAGPFSNILLALFVMILFFIIINPIIGLITTPSGISFEEVTVDMPAAIAGIESGKVINYINGVEIKTAEDFLIQLSTLRPNETITLTGEKEYSLVSTQHPEIPEKGYIGIVGINNELELKNKTTFMQLLLAVVLWFQELFKWIFMLSLGIGLANLLPLGPIDGGRMVQTATLKLFSDKRKADKIWKRISIVCLAVLVLLIFFPFFQWLVRLFT